MNCVIGLPARLPQPEALFTSGPSSGDSTASAMRGHAESMIAAPGSSIFPSSARSSRLAPRAAQALSSWYMRRARSLGGLSPPLRSTCATTGQTCAARKSVVAAAFIADTTDASVCFRRLRSPASSMSER